jgi:hypothetical protein
MTKDPRKLKDFLDFFNLFLIWLNKLWRVLNLLKDEDLLTKKQRPYLSPLYQIQKCVYFHLLEWHHLLGRYI